MGNSHCCGTGQEDPRQRKKDFKAKRPEKKKNERKQRNIAHTGEKLRFKADAPLPP